MEYLVLMSGGYDSAVLKEFVKSKGMKYTVYHCNFVEYATDNTYYSFSQLNRAETLKFLNNNAEERTIFSRICAEKENSFDIVGGESVRSSYVPARNSLLVLDAVNKFYGTHHKEEKVTVLIGLIKTYPQFPDGSEAWVESFNKFLEVEFGGKVKLEAPLIKLDKDEVYKLGCSLNVDLNKTFSCNYEKDGKECGKCGNCLWKKKHTYPMYRRYLNGRQK